MTLKLRTWLKDEFASGKLSTNLIVGLLIGITEVVFAISMGSLIFSGELNDYRAISIGVALFTCMVVLISISIMGSIPRIIATVQDSPAVIMALIVSGLVSSIPSGSVEAKIATVLVTITITTLLTGGVLILLGHFKLGSLVRFVPYPVIGGFLAGIGWLLVQGSFGVMADFGLSLGTIGELVQADQMLLWLPGLFIAIILFLGMRRIDHSLAMPAILLGVVLVFFLGLLVTGTTIEEAINLGLLMGDLPGEMSWSPLSFRDFRIANWGSILGQGGHIATILIISVLGLLLNSSAVELAIEEEVDLNQELRVAGIANLISGVGGGLVGFQTVLFSVLAHRTGARGRLVGIVAGAVCGLMLFVGTGLLELLPKAILGGLLLFFGLDFLSDWIVSGWSKLSRIDYAVVILILFVIAATDFLVGVGVGLVAMIILFVINYSQINVIRYSLSGADLHSNVERLERQKETLKRLGERIYIMELQGFIFFGTSRELVEQAKKRLAEKDKQVLRFIIFDFKRVTGLDSSAVFSFIKCRQLAEQEAIHIVLTDLPQDIHRQLSEGGLFENSPRVRTFPDLDRGLEWCENRLLALESELTPEQPTSLSERLVDAGFLEDDIDRLMGYLEKAELEEGECLLRQGEKSDCLYFTESGQLSIYLNLESEEQVRLQTLSARLIIGEMGLYRGTTRTASIVADEPSVVYGLPKATLERMKKDNPRLAVSLHEFIATQLADRLADTTRLLGALTK